MKLLDKKTFTMDTHPSPVDKVTEVMFCSNDQEGDDDMLSMSREEGRSLLKTMDNDRARGEQLMSELHNLWQDSELSVWDASSVWKDSGAGSSPASTLFDGYSTQLSSVGTDSCIGESSKHRVSKENNGVVTTPIFTPRSETKLSKPSIIKPSTIKRSSSRISNRPQIAMKSNDNTECKVSPEKPSTVRAQVQQLQQKSSDELRQNRLQMDRQMSSKRKSTDSSSKRTDGTSRKPHDPSKSCDTQRRRPDERRKRSDSQTPIVRGTWLAPSQSVKPTGKSDEKSLRKNIQCLASNIQLLPEEPREIVMCSVSVDKTICFRSVDKYNKEKKLAWQDLLVKAYVQSEMRHDSEIPRNTEGKPNRVKAKVSDCLNGYYEVSFCLDEAGEYTLYVTVSGNTTLVPIRCGMQQARLSHYNSMSKIPRPNLSIRRNNSFTIMTSAKIDVRQRRKSSDSDDSGLCKRTQTPRSRHKSPAPQTSRSRHKSPAPQTPLTRHKSLAPQTPLTRHKSPTPQHTPRIMSTTPSVKRSPSSRVQQTRTAVRHKSPAPPRNVDFRSRSQQIARKTRATVETPSGSTEELQEEDVARIRSWLADCSYDSGFEPLIPDFEPDEVSDEQAHRHMIGDVITRWDHRSFGSPQGLCTFEGNVAAADSSHGVVHVLDSESGRLQHQLRNDLDRPVGVCSSHGSLYVSDYKQSCIQHFSSTGVLIQSIKHAAIKAPKGILIDERGQLIVADTKAKCVLVMSPDGRLIRRLGGPSSDAKLTCPQFVAPVTPDVIAVTDFQSDLLKLYNVNTGMSVGGIGGHGQGMGHFWGPSGVAVDQSGVFIVADCKNSRLQVLDKHLSFDSFVDTTGEALFSPQGVTVVSDQCIAVADSGNRCIKLFSYGENAGVTDIDADVTGITCR